jgi:hypothetical protein
MVLMAHAQGQDEIGAREMKAKAEEKLAQLTQMRVQAIGAVKGMTVKNAPYSGEEVNETNQVLADGTRIHREIRAMVYRDSEGRTRRETPESTIINDPVANTTYILNSKTMTGQKLTSMVQYSTIRKPTATGTFTMTMESDGGSPTIAVNGEPLDQKKVQELIAQAKANGEPVTFTKDATVTHVFAGTKMAGAMMKPTGESIGKQTIEGVSADGTRTVNTIKAGTIGNDRDILVTSESWYSPELQTMIMTKHSDPRTGEESFRLTNINRNEPASYLFQVPSGYTMK